MAPPLLLPAHTHTHTRVQGEAAAPGNKWGCPSEARGAEAGPLGEGLSADVGLIAPSAVGLFLSHRRQLGGHGAAGGPGRRPGLADGGALPARSPGLDAATRTREFTEPAASRSAGAAHRASLRGLHSCDRGPSPRPPAGEAGCVLCSWRAPLSPPAGPR